MLLGTRFNNKRSFMVMVDDVALKLECSIHQAVQVFFDEVVRFQAVT